MALASAGLLPRVYEPSFAPAEVGRPETQVLPGVAAAFEKIEPRKQARNHPKRLKSSKII